MVEYIQERGSNMNDYQKIAMDVSYSAVRQARKLSIKKYLRDNILGILALIVAIIALFK